MRRRFVTLFTALSFGVLAVSGVLAFVRPFSLTVVGLHSLMGFAFIVLVGLHVANSFQPMRRHLRGRAPWISLAVVGGLAGVLLMQPKPVKALLGLSGNLGPALERFEMREDAMVFHYSPDPDYRMKLSIRTGAAFDSEEPPGIAIWLENQSLYHIKTLLHPEPDHLEALPYWSFKRRGWKRAREDEEKGIDVDAVSGATQNSSFDPADYILPADPDNPMPYRLLVEINQPGDAHAEIADQPSLVYAVEIDNAFPRAYQVLELEGFPKREDSGEGKEDWALYFVDEGFGSALELIDSALLTIDRNGP